MGHLGPDLLKGEQAGGVAGKELVVIVLHPQAGDVVQTPVQSPAGPLLHGLGVVAQLGAQGGYPHLRGGLPPLEQGQVLKLRELKSEQKFTQPPARYTEATLIKALEENGIGRPSTYAPIITTIIDRGYVEREQKKLKPTLLGRAVDGLMLEQFPHIVDVDFSAEMEKNLDKVESGKTDWHKTVDDFYKGFAASLEQAEKNMEGKKVKVPDEPSSEVCDLCGRPMVIKVGKYGKFLACSGFPECRGTKRLVKDTGGICPKCGKGRMLERKSAKGRIYYGCERYPDCDFMTWDMPVAVKCEKCGSTLFRKGSKLYCAKEGCDFEMPVPKKD